MDKVTSLLTEQNIFNHTNQGIRIVKVQNETQGCVVAKDILTLLVDPTSLLLLSGGRTPKALYASLAQSEQIEPGAVGLIDERFGTKFHKNSNEQMIKETGFLRYLEMRGISFFPILYGDASLSETALTYDAKLREVQFLYQKTVGILGIGLDGHTAGIPAHNEKHTIVSPALYSDSDMVAGYDDNGKYGERVTMTFLGLEHLDYYLVLVFGNDKKDALDEVFSEGSELAIPGRFFKRPLIADKTMLITDQDI